MSEGFFERLPEPPPPERYRLPEWRQPPATELAALVPIRQRIAHSDRGVAVVLSHIDAFSNGCSFRIRTTIHRRPGLDDAEWEELNEAVTGYHPGRGWHRSPGDMLRFGVQLSDGRRLTTEGPVPYPEHDQQPDGHVLTQLGGSGGGDGWLLAHSWSLWLWPLPPPEPFDLVVTWPGVGIDLARTELSGRDIHDAATHTRPLLPDAP